MPETITCDNKSCNKTEPVYLKRSWVSLETQDDYHWGSNTFGLNKTTFCSEDCLYEHLHTRKEVRDASQGSGKTDQPPS